jgi:hypothetical protein
MLWMDFGDGNWWIAPINGLPFVTSHTWASAGTYEIVAKGFSSVAVAESNAVVSVPTPWGGFSLPGGFRETGLQFWRGTDGQLAYALPTLPGQWMSPAAGSAYNYSMALDPSRIPTSAAGATVRFGSLHVHPAGVMAGRNFNQEPSPYDLANQAGSFGIVVGARDQRVYFYSGGEQVGRPMSLRDFNRRVR